mmetsp:Transcript_26038/g.61014  ORF Transcript_26038/g.61014 Transcript_26038/m.61014 type:complete len:432 (-) Transcript_26038:305-1600(-)
MRREARGHAAAAAAAARGAAPLRVGRVDVGDVYAVERQGRVLVDFPHGHLPRRVIVVEEAVVRAGEGDGRRVVLRPDVDQERARRALRRPVAAVAAVVDRDDEGVEAVPVLRAAVDGGGEQSVELVHSAVEGQAHARPTHQALVAHGAGGVGQVVAVHGPRRAGARRADVRPADRDDAVARHEGEGDDADRRVDVGDAQPDVAPRGDGVAGVDHVHVVAACVEQEVGVFVHGHGSVVARLEHCTAPVDLGRVVHRRHLHLEPCDRLHRAAHARVSHIVRTDPDRGVTVPVGGRRVADRLERTVHSTERPAEAHLAPLPRLAPTEHEPRRLLEPQGACLATRAQQGRVGGGATAREPGAVGDERHVDHLWRLDERHRPLVAALKVRSTACGLEACVRPGFQGVERLDHVRRGGIVAEEGRVRRGLAGVGEAR